MPGPCYVNSFKVSGQDILAEYLSESSDTEWAFIKGRLKKLACLMNFNIKIVGTTDNNMEITDITDALPEYSGYTLKYGD